MDSRALINETLKYLGKNENGQPKYRFDVYKNGITQSLNKATSLLTGGLVSSAISEDESAPIPVSVYTIGDIFNTVRDTTGDVMRTIGELPNTLDNIKMSLKQLGYNALNKTLDTIKAAVAPIEVIQTVNDIYRIARPLVEKVVDIASIMFHFENAAKVAQDVLQYLSRLAVSTARNYLTRLFNILMDTPVFAVYENDNTVSLSGAYSFLSTAADNALDKLLDSDDSFAEIMNYVNTASSKKMYEPGYNNLGITIDDDIVDVYSDPITRKIFIASKHDIYQLNSDYTTTALTNFSDENITKIFYYDNEVYFITSGKIYKVGEGGSWNLTNPVIVYSNPLLIYSSGNFYNPKTKAVVFQDIMNYSAFDHGRGILYYIKTVNGSNKLMMNTVNSLGNFSDTPSELGDISNTIYGLAYFNDVLYVIKKSGSEYYVSKINAGTGFDKIEYTDADSIIYLNNELATDGSWIYSKSGIAFNFINKTPNSINSVIRQTYKSKNYLIATGGTDVNITRYNAGSKDLSWFSKSIDSNGVAIKNIGLDDGSNEVPDNFSGCTWFNGQAGQTLVINSQSNIYVIAGKGLDDLFTLPEEETLPPLVYKSFKTLNDWFTDLNQYNPPDIIECAAKYEIDEGCVITKIKKIGNKLYVAVFNPNVEHSSGIRTGVYELVISHLSSNYTININTANPVYTVKNENHKIYSFDFYNGELYFTDGEKLYNATSGSESNLKLDNDDRALEVVNENRIVIYTSKMKLTKQSSSSMGDISSAIKYKSTSGLSIASTENTLMISDGNFVYNAIDNGEDAINSELFQICFEKGVNNFSLLQSNNAAFIISRNSIKKVPLYDSISSSDYGCGYYTDTTPNKWMGAAPYYFSSKVLNNKKNRLSRQAFIKGFKENFKVELEKLLIHIPDAFVNYTKDKIAKELSASGYTIDGDDGQILKLMVESVSSNTANSIGMYVQNKFMEKIGDDTTYNTFAENVYQACLEDRTNNMTEDFYKIFGELYRSTIIEAITQMELGEGGLSEFLLRYYQNHKAEWAQSMTDLIDVDIVDPELYEMPLKDSEKTLSKDTYVFDYTSGHYAHKYVASPSKDYNEVIKGYYDSTSDAFYEDALKTEEIDERVFDNISGTWSLNGEIVCYKNPADNKLYRFKINDYVLSEDTTVESGKTYYNKVDDSYRFVLTADATESKPYYTPTTYELTSDTSVVSGKGYYTKSGSEETIYEIATPASGHGYLDLNSYYTKSGYVKTTDTQIVSGKTYYEESYVLAASSESGVQYYKIDYVPTSDTTINPDKTYFEFVDLSSFSSSDIVYIPAPTGTTATRYDVNFKPFGLGDYVFNGTYYIYDQGPSDYPRYDVTFTANSNGSYIYNNGHYEYSPSSEETKYIVSTVKQPNYIFDDNTVYYTYDSQSGIYNIAETLDLQYGPFYYADGFVQSANGQYIRSTVGSTGSSYYSEVINPNVNNLSVYYEKTFVPVSAYSSDVYKIEYTAILSPDVLNISSYYEEGDEYILEDNPNYVYDSEGRIIGIEPDRVYYKATTDPLEYTFVNNPSGNPASQGWYEASDYSQIIEGNTDNPASEHLYERSYTPMAFNVVSSSSGSPASQGWYEYSYSYVSPYEESRVYIDLEPVTVSSNFKELDDDWHDSFYEAAVAAGESVNTKEEALSALDNLVFPYPDWKWEALLNESVSTIYIPTQGEQFRQIVIDSDMEPIQWQELPSKINRESFRYALNTLLYMIKQRLLTNITILVDGGKVKCYSCVDASTVIKKIVNRNYVIWRNQIRTAKAKVEKANNITQIRAAFTMVKAFDETLFLLERILNDQSRLYARYLDELIEEQIINDNETEVTL